MLILGIDPGLAKTGWGVIEARGAVLAYVDSGVLKTSSSSPHIERLRAIGVGLREVMAAARPDLIAVERVFINRNPNSSLLLGEARGAALMALLEADAPVLEISALQIKQSVTGAGRAGKRQVADMVGRLLSISSQSLALDSTDALACALAANARQRVGFAPRRRSPRSRRGLRTMPRRG